MIRGSTNTDSVPVVKQAAGTSTKYDALSTMKHFPFRVTINSILSGTEEKRTKIPSNCLHECHFVELNTVVMYESFMFKSCSVQ